MAGRLSAANVLECLLSGKVIDPELLERLQALGFDLKALIACLERHCRERTRTRTG